MKEGVQLCWIAKEKADDWSQNEYKTDSVTRLPFYRILISEINHLQLFISK